MINHYNADGTVKQSWPDAITAETFVREDKSARAQIHFSNAIQTVQLAEGEQVGAGFITPVVNAAPSSPAGSLVTMDVEDLQKVPGLNVTVHNGPKHVPQGNAPREPISATEAAALVDAVAIITDVVEHAIHPAPSAPPPIVPTAASEAVQEAASTPAIASAVSDGI